MRPLYALCLGLSLATAPCACSATRAVRPVGAGRLGVSASLGGPLVTNVGPPIPLPVPVVAARLGITDRTEVDMGVLLPLLPLVGIDLGVAHLWLTERGARPAGMVSGRVILQGPTDRGSAWAPPSLEAQATFSWSLTQALLGYVGAVALAPTHPVDVLPSVLAGVRYDVPQSRLQLTAEGRWLALTSRSDDVTVSYIAPGSHGALGVVLAVAYSFDLRQKAPHD